MNLSTLMADRSAQNRPIRVGLIGAGKFGTMFLAQARTTPGLHVAALADTEPHRGHTALALAQWPPLKAVARSLPDALDTGGTWVTTDPLALIERPGLDVIIQATGFAPDSIRHALAAMERKLHVIMVNLAADVLAGPLLAARAQKNGVVYSLAYGDQPALICELVGWATACGFEMAAAGRGANWLPGHERTTPETVWPHFRVTPEQARAAGMNANVFTAFMDGTRPALELASVSNATGLAAPATGLTCPACGTDDLARIMKPNWDGGRLDAMGQVEVASSLERDGRRVAADLGAGVWVTFRAPSDYTTRCFPEYGRPTDPSGSYASRWRPHPLMGMEVGVSVASVALRREPTGCPRGFNADVVAMAKTDLPAGTPLDGPGGFTVWGKLLPSTTSVERGGLPMGLAHGVTLARPVEAGHMLTWADVQFAAADDDIVALRRKMEAIFTPPRPI